MKKIYSVLVENRSGVLCKVAGLFSRRCFNIDSLAVGETEDTMVSRMTIVSSGDERTIEQIEKQLNKKIDVIKVKTFDEPSSVSREHDEGREHRGDGAHGHAGAAEVPGGRGVESDVFLCNTRAQAIKNLRLILLAVIQLFLNFIDIREVYA